PDTDLTRHVDQIRGARVRTHPVLGDRAEIGVVVHQHGQFGYGQEVGEMLPQLEVLPPQVGRVGDGAGGGVDEYGDRHPHTDDAAFGQNRVQGELTQDRGDLLHTRLCSRGASVEGNVYVEQFPVQQVDRDQGQVVDVDLQADRCQGGVVQRQ